MMIPLPILLEFAWAHTAPGREAAPQNEVLRAFQPCPVSGKPDIEPTPPNDRVLTLDGHARPPETGYNLWPAGRALIVPLMLKLSKRRSARGCDAADCGLAQTARYARVHSAL